MTRKKIALSIVLVMVSVAGCGGGSSGGQAGSDPTGSPPGGSSSESYSLGGTISGLTASGLVLANGNVTVGPAAGASAFAFPGTLTSGTYYDVTVQEQPSGLSCKVSDGSGPVGNSAVTSVSVSCTANEFAYVAVSESDEVAGFTINFTTGALSPISGSPFAGSGTGGIGLLATDPSGHFVYAIAAGNYSQSILPSIVVYSINPGTGALTPVSDTTFNQGTADSVIVDSTGHFLYVGYSPSNPGQNYILAYSINSGTGALTSVPGSPFQTSAFPVWSTIDTSGKYLYVANGTSAISGYAINSSTGALAPIAGNPFSVQASVDSVVADPDQPFIYSSANTAITVYDVDSSTGTLTPTFGGSQQNSQTTRLAIDPVGRFVYLIGPGNDVSAFTINATNGELTAVPGGPYPTGSNPSYGGAVDTSGQFLYVVNQGDSSISAYTIDSSTGALASVAGTPYATEPTPTAIIVTQPRS